MVRGPDNALWFTEHGAGRLGRITANGVVTEYRLPTSRSGPAGITLGHDGALWFTEDFADRIGRLDPRTGNVREYVLPHRGFRPYQIVAGPDGALWFTGSNFTGVERLDPTTGVVSDYVTDGFQASGITVGPDHALWLTFLNSQDIARLTMAGTLTSYNRSGFFTGEPTAITMGPDHALWFTEVDTYIVGRVGPGLSPKAFATHGNSYAMTIGSDGNLWFTEDLAIGRVTPAGVVQEYPLDAQRDGGALGIAAGPDQGIWFTEPYADQIGRIGRDGTITRFSLTGATLKQSTSAPAIEPIAHPARQLGASPTSIARAPDGSIWFTETFSNRLGHVTTGGDVQFFPLAQSRADPAGITVASDGTVWFTEFYGSAVGHLDPATGQIRIYPLPSEGSEPKGIVVAADGSVWFTEYYAGQIGKLDPHTGRITEFALPVSSGPWAVIRGPKGSFWFTEHDSNAIGNIGADGTVRQYPIAAPSGAPNREARPEGLTAGPNGTIWIAEAGFGAIGSMTPAGMFRIFYPRDFSQGYPIDVAAAPNGRIWYLTTEGGVGRLFDTGPQLRFPAAPPPLLLLVNSIVSYDWAGLVVAQDGTPWVAESTMQAIDHLQLDGTVHRFPMPGHSSEPIAVVATGTDLWIAQPGSDSIARRAADGQITEYPLPTADAQPSSLAAAPDGSLYFTEQQTGKIGRIDQAGQIREYALQNGGAAASALAVVPDPSSTIDGYTVWFTESAASRIGKLDPVTGALQEFPMPAAVTCPDTLAVATSGTLYLGFCQPRQPATVQPDGSIMILTGLPTTAYGLLRSGPDDGILVTGELGQNNLQRLTQRGTVIDDKLPDTYSTPTDAVVGPGGKIWFTEAAENRVGVLDPTTHAVKEFAVPTPLASPTGITVDANGTVWFTERDGNAVASITPAGTIHEYPL
jgi:streptogramin lyase